MQLVEPKISILIGVDETTIIIRDSQSSVSFVEVKLTPEQLSAALSRQMHTPCEVTVHKLDKVGKKMEHMPFEFPIPEGSITAENRKKILINQCDAQLQLQGLSAQGWISDHYYNSQNTFFTKHGISHARTTIRRWV